MQEANTAGRKVTFLGLGAMGARMAANVKKGGFELTVYNRDEQKTEPFKEQDCKVATNPAQAVADADFVITMLSNDYAVEQVMLGENGALQAMRPGKVYINMSTTSPELADRLDSACQKQKVQALAAPVAGSIKPAEEGKLVILAGGPRAAFEQAESLLKTMGQNIQYFESAAKALTMKLIVNGFIQGQLAVFAELLALGQKAELGREQVIQTLTNGAGASPWIKDKGQKMLANDYSPAFSLELTRKDIGLTLQEFQKYNVPGVVTAAIDQLYSLATNMGRNEEDMSVLVPLVAKLAGLDGK
ncbi:MAG TPA: NAD(P)-dependent oxidoreductase [Chloroflexia bacterium]|nr:NAD(P)-dependent oxidoreductase [Chloroflexia bacterium]